MQDLDNLKVGDKIVYHRRIGYFEPGIVKKIEGDMIHIYLPEEGYLDGRIVVHRNNVPGISQDWITKDK